MKLRRKLLSAGLAFGATALTLTTSTFAWYTANNEVTVGTVQGRTSVQADTSSLYIAAAESYATATTGTEESPVSYVAPGAKVYNISTYGSTKNVAYVGNVASAERELTPVAYNEGKYGTLNATPQYVSVESPEVGNIGTYYERGGEAPSYTYTLTKDAALDNGKTYYTRTSDAVTYNYDSTGAYVYEFVLRFQVPNISGTKDVYLSKFDLQNTAVASDSQQNVLTYDENGTSTGLKSGGQYNVDMLHALKMTVQTTTLTSAGDYYAANSTDETVTTKVYDLDGYAVTSKDSDNLGATVNAVGYYNNVLGTNIVTPENYLAGATCVKSRTNVNADAAASEQTLSKLFTVPSTGFIEVRFTFWLDGWDSFCYDVCRKQNFSVDMAFSTTATKSIWTAATAATGKAA